MFETVWLRNVISRGLDLWGWARASAEKFPGGPTKKRPKNSKKHRKIALLSLNLLYLYHV